MRYMGIDFGTKKLGIAFSDEGGQMAFPHAVVPNDGELLKNVEKLILEKKVGEIVIGHSLGKDGKANKVQEAIDGFMLDITLNFGLPVHLEPEQYSTQEAMQIQGRTDMTDASAAAIILNSYLSRIKNAS